MNTTPDFSNLSFFELLFLFISLPGMLLWAKVVTDAIRNMLEGSPKLTPLGQRLGDWLRARSPLEMQEVIIGLISAVPVLAYVILAIWMDASLRSVEPIYEFLKWLCVAQIAAAAYYQFVKTRAAAPPAVVMPAPGASFDPEKLAQEIATNISDKVVQALLANNAVLLPKKIAGADSQPAEPPWNKLRVYGREEDQKTADLPPVEDVDEDDLRKPAA